MALCQFLFKNHVLTSMKPDDIISNIEKILRERRNLMTSSTKFNIPREKLLENVTALGLSISPTTLNRYVKAQLITPPERGHLGVGYGTFTFYHPGSHIELATAYSITQRSFPKMGALKWHYEPELPLFTLPKTDIPDLANARKNFVEYFLGIPQDNPIKALLVPYCDSMYFIDIKSPSLERHGFDLQAFMAECSELEGQATPAETNMVKDMVIDAYKYTDSKEPINLFYKALFCRFALWDTITKNKLEKV